MDPFCVVRATAAAVAVAAVVLASTARTVSAQSPVKLGLAGGFALPMSNTADANERGYNGTVTIAVNAPLFPLGLRVDGMFNRMLGRDDLVGNLNGPDLDVSSVSANLTYTVLPLAIARVYLIGGAGFYRADLEDSGIDTESRIGYNGGAGIRLDLGGRQLFVEARYHRVELRDDVRIDFVPVTIGFLF